MRRFASFIEYQVSQGAESIKVDLALDSPFRFAPAEVGDFGVKVNDLQDLQADKTLAFYGRTEPRDAVDFYFLLQTTSFEDLAEHAGQKDTGFDLYWFAIALNRTASYPDEIERWPVKMLADCDPVAMKRTYQGLAMQIMSKHTGNQ